MDPIEFEISRPLSDRDAFAEGELIRGVLRTTLFQDAAAHIGQLDLVLRGRSEVRLFERNFSHGSTVRLPYRQNGVTPLFEYRKTLHYWRYPQTPAPGRYVWPMDFEFPRYANLPYNPEHESRPQLPPTFTLYSTDPKWIGSTRVVYELEAQIYSWQGYVLRTASTEVQFKPNSWYPVPSPGLYTLTQPLTIESPYLAPYARQAKLSRFAARMSLSKLPISQLNISVELPAHATHNDPLPLYLKLDYDTDKSTATELPAVHLNAITIKFQEKLQIGPNSAPGSSNLIIIPENTWKTYSISYASAPLLLTERLDIRTKISPDTLLVTGLSFTNSLMRRFYDSLTVSLTIECAKKAHELSFKSNHELTIHPPRAPESRMELPAAVPSPVSASSPVFGVPPVTGGQVELMGDIYPAQPMQGAQPMLAAKLQPPAQLAELPFKEPPAGYGRAELPG